MAVKKKIAKVTKGSTLDIYQPGICKVYTDRVTVGSKTFRETIKNKGIINRLLSSFFKDLCKDIVPSDLVISTPPISVTENLSCEEVALFMDKYRAEILFPLYKMLGFEQKDFVGRIEYCKNVNMIPLEFNVFGVLPENEHRKYKETGLLNDSVSLPQGLEISAVFDEPITTYELKEKKAANIPIPAEYVTEMLASWLKHNKILIKDFSNDFARENSIRKPDYHNMAELYYNDIQNICKQVFNRISEYCKAKGMLLVSLKLEFGLDATNSLILADELGTTDTARYTKLKDFNIGESFIGFDKSFIDENYADSVCLLDFLINGFSKQYIKLFQIMFPSYEGFDNYMLNINDIWVNKTW